MITLRFDGLFRGVPRKNVHRSSAGFMCYGWIISRRGVIIARGHGGFARGADANSQIAEYLALIDGLDAAKDMKLGDEPVEITGDSKGVIGQMQGHIRVSEPSVVPLFHRAARLAQRLNIIRWMWLPRRYNRAADFLARYAMKQVRLDQQSYEEVVDAFLTQKWDAFSLHRFIPLVDLRVYCGSLPLGN